VRTAIGVPVALVLFCGTTALLLWEPGTAFVVLPVIALCLVTVPFFRIDVTPWIAAPPLAAVTLWAGSAPGYYVLPLFGAAVCAALFGLVMLIRFGPLRRRRPPPREARRTWLVSLVAGLVVAFVSAGMMPLELRFRLSEATMVRTARDLLAGRRDPTELERIGLWKVDDVEIIPGGVRFLVEGAGLFDQSGFLYVTNGLPPPEARYYRSGWYTWSTDFEL
jgi:hypothetical protein